MVTADRRFAAKIRRKHLLKLDLSVMRRVSETTYV
jgi:hypothetical protein